MILDYLVGPKSSGKGLCKRKAEKRGQHRERRRRDWCDAATGQQTPRNDYSTQKREDTEQVNVTGKRDCLERSAMGVPTKGAKITLGQCISFLRLPKENSTNLVA